MYQLKIISNFAAAHQLSLISKKCESLHGHNWKVEVSVTGKQLNEAGVLIDFTVLKKHLKHIIKKLDHTFLNDLEYFNKTPSSENISIYIANKMQKAIKDSHIKVSKVSIWESDNACASYYPIL